MHKGLLLCSQTGTVPVADAGKRGARGHDTAPTVALPRGAEDLDFSLIKPLFMLFWQRIHTRACAHTTTAPLTQAHVHTCALSSWNSALLLPAPLPCSCPPSLHAHILTGYCFMRGLFYITKPSPVSPLNVQSRLCLPWLSQETQHNPG